MTDETKNDGGPAFPAHPEHYDNDSTGMTLRDYFAAQALAGYFANPSTPHRNASDCASYMYEMADAMLRERSK